MVVSYELVRPSSSSSKMGHPPLRVGGVTPSRGGVTSSSRTPTLVDEEATFRNTRKPCKNKYMVMGPDGTRNQNCLRWRGLAAIYLTDRPTAISFSHDFLLCEEYYLLR
jgi:hypothetical protein